MVSALFQPASVGIDITDTLEGGLLNLDGRRTGAPCIGDFIIAAYRINHLDAVDRLLVISLQDTAEGNSLCLSLYADTGANTDPKLLDEAYAPSPASALPQDYRLQDLSQPAQLRFEFHGPWEVQLLRRPEPTLPGFLEPWGVLHKRPFLRHFRLVRPRKA